MRKERNFPGIFTDIGSEQLTKIDIEYIKAIAKEAGDRAVTMLNDIKVEFKKDDSLVTHIDRQTELFIRGKLEEKYPGYAFQGEEYGRVGADGIPLWAVDPIDGTTNMVFGIPLWGVSIGLIVDGVAVAGVFYMPLTNQMFWGVRGEGSFCNGVRLQTKDRTEIHPEDTVGFTSGAIKTLEFREISGRIRSLGSIATEVVYAAKGSLCSHVGCYEGANDLAAALCIAHESGCVSIYLDTGEPLDLYVIVKEDKTRGPFIVAPPKMASLIRSLVKTK